MSKTELIEKTIAGLRQLPENDVKEIHDFTEFLMSKLGNKLLTEEVTLLNTKSSSFKFLEDDEDIYSVDDLKVKFEK